MKGIPLCFKSTAMGFYQAVYALGMTAFPVMCGKITAGFSMTTAFYTLAGICFGATLIASFFSPLVSQKNDE